MEPANRQHDEVARIAAKSATLHKELRQRDLVLLQILLIMGIGWVGTAARQGSTHVVIWGLAIALFYLPLAAVVVHLGRAIPLEGGFYQWVKLGLGPLAGFLAAWNLWMYYIVVFGANGVGVATCLAYAIGPGAAWMLQSKLFINAVNVAYFALVFGIGVRGFHVGKWATGAGAAVNIAVYALLAGLLVARLVRGPAPAHAPFSVAVPALSLMSVNLFSKIAVNALGGFEHVPVFAGEYRDAGRAIARSTRIAAPVIALLYIVGTGSLLVHTPPQEIDLAAPIPQVLAAGLGGAGRAALLAPVAIFAISFAGFAQSSAMVAEAARMPLVAGWDGLLPAWFTRLHPRHRTPVSALVTIVLASLAVGALSLVGAEYQEAVQLMLSASLGCCGIYYLLILGVPLFAAHRLTPRPSLPLRLAALSAWLVTLLSIVFQLVPIIDVESRWTFGLKVGVTMLGANLVGVALYTLGRRRAARAAARGER